MLYEGRVSDFDAMIDADRGRRRPVRPSSLKLVTAPAAEPVLLADVKAQLRIDDSDEDETLASFIKAARRKCENYTRRAFITQTWEQAWDGQPDGRIVTLGKAPLASVTSITSYNDAGTASVFSSSNYLVDTGSEPGRVALVTGQVWPSDLRPMNSLVIRFVAGYGASGASVPDDILTAIRQTVGWLYENREGLVSANYAASVVANDDLPGITKALLTDYIVNRVRM